MNQFHKGDLLVHTYRGKDEYVRVECDEGSWRPFRDIEKYCRMAGRFVFEIACSNPVPPQEPPARILRVVHFGTPRCRVKKEMPFGGALLSSWGTMTEGEVEGEIREHVKFHYDISHFLPISIRSSRLDLLVERRMATPMEGCFSTEI